ncbi:DUF4169 family protein [Tabrizicola sp.]|uniref:DUF4169 family protein n=1 Tax=Tabrizicola sp. TaxID=2005166 RepID=UPI00286C1A33|nr:DUF4169 family protein [Tabrizicola sp.]
MSVVNLNTARKAKAKATARAQADTNTVKHGLTKAERALQKAKAEKAARDLAAHQRDPE